MKFPWQLYHWHFEISAKCTLKCPRCPRNDQDRVPWFNKEISLEQFKKILSPELLKNEVKRITMCGDIGDPIYGTEYLEIVEYIKKCNPKIHVFTITCGNMKKEEWWTKFAKISNEYDTINFSVDGYNQETNNLYRINSNWESIMTGMKIMAKDSPIHVYWAAIVFSFNQDHLDDIYQQAKNIGCDGVQFTYSTKFGSKYGIYGEDDALEPRKEFISKTHRYERHFKDISGRKQLNEEYMKINKQQFVEVMGEYNKMIRPMCNIGNRGLYVSADGVLHPCSWVSFPYVSLQTKRKTINFKDSFHQIYRDKLNILNRPLIEVLEDDVWGKLFNTFNDRQKAWVECEQKCSCNLVNKEYAVGFLTN